MNIIGNRKIFFAISLILIAASLFGIFSFGLKWGIDFVGGTLWQVRIEPRYGDAPSASEVRQFLSTQELTDAIVYAEEASQSIFIRTRILTQEERFRYLDALSEEYGVVNELKLDTIGPSVSGELSRGAVQGVLLVLLAISLYVAFAFRQVSHHMSSIKYGIITLITLLHDAIIAFGFYVFLTRFIGIEIGVSTIVALLIVVGFSVHDTIVVFDRIRENLLLSKNTDIDFASVVNTSVNQTLFRSFATSLTLALVLVALFFFGPALLKYFVLTILVGTIVGTYSSIFIASPILVVWHKHGRRAVLDNTTDARQ